MLVENVDAKFSFHALLASLARQGMIRQLDWQFARFIEAQSGDERLGFIAGVVSAELGKGHICLTLFGYEAKAMPNATSVHCDFASKLGLYGDAGRALNRACQAIDWQTVLSNSPLVGVQSQVEPEGALSADEATHAVATPLMFDGERLYLQRYWHYEVTLANKLNQLSGAMSLTQDQITQLRQRLDHLFARQYHYLWQALQRLDNSSANQRQQLCGDMLDIVDDSQLDWPTIDRCLCDALTLPNGVRALEQLDTLVPLSACINWQKVAAAVALTRRFAVISGGPGTGKTTTVTKLLAALLELDPATRPTIKLVAPTGKAAARLTESMGKAVHALPIDPDQKAHIPTEASTLHRLLGAIPNSAEFRHHRHNPLHLDILVVDEASMVDLSLMYKLVDALPQHARLILLGDKDQLASVEAGAILGDICAFQRQGYSRQQAAMLAKLTGFEPLAASAARVNISAPVADSLCMLQKSYRFDARSGIGQLAKAINSGQVAQLETVWRLQFDDISHAPLNHDSYHEMIQTLVAQYRAYLQLVPHPLSQFALASHDQSTLAALSSAQRKAAMEEKAKQALSAFNRCRLLCALREGDFGVTGLNHRIERALAARRLIHTQEELWYAGRPVMVTRNDHALGLYNGDIGICLLDESLEPARLKVFFELPNGQIKAVLPSRVPEHETAYAMTVHKSQGSEFEFTLMVLPPNISPILTRELIYTGVTRAKQRLALYADLAILNRGISVKTERASGLISRLRRNF
ncbi:exodeoxyribonuclease V subunit alpha [Vibrio sp. SM6]|uniref:RecBCD enzyme subunit RecD n=2 Tax=Vibrio agarilyticus TaxID=2726741 RepID=A0A7X8TQH3_9VIBR|nr:exodeoxyribonuclease V subunit alpha [Vibrio agarilyticus]